MTGSADDGRRFAALTLRELRELAQRPERGQNDLGGVLFGDWISPPLTREFLRHDISPTVATVGMLVAGVTGAVLLPFGGAWSVLAGLCFVLFYLLDCVDGEVARLRGIERFFWAYPDFFFGAVVMALFHLALGVHAYLTTGIAWMLLAGATLALALMLKKMVDVCHVFLTVGHVIEAQPERRRRYAAELGLDLDAHADAAEAATETLSRREVIRRYGGVAGILRGAATNFHLAVLAFVVLAALDLVVGPWPVAGVPIDLKTAFLLAYLPLYVAHLADHFVFLWRGAFLARSAALLRRLARGAE